MPKFENFVKGTLMALQAPQMKKLQKLEGISEDGRESVKSTSEQGSWSIFNVKQFRKMQTQDKMARKQTNVFDSTIIPTASARSVTLTEKDRRDSLFRKPDVKNLLINKTARKMSLIRRQQENRQQIQFEVRKSAEVRKSTQDALAETGQSGKKVSIAISASDQSGSANIAIPGASTNPTNLSTQGLSAEKKISISVPHTEGASADSNKNGRKSGTTNDDKRKSRYSTSSARSSHKSIASPVDIMRNARKKMSRKMFSRQSAASKKRMNDREVLKSARGSTESDKEYFNLRDFEVKKPVTKTSVTQSVPLPQIASAIAPPVISVAVAPPSKTLPVNSLNKLLSPTPPTKRRSRASSYVDIPDFLAPSRKGSFMSPEAPKKMSRGSAMIDRAAFKKDFNQHISEAYEEARESRSYFLLAHTHCLILHTQILI